MEQKKATNQYFTLIALTDIESSEYQRSTNSTQVGNIIKNFNEAKLGTLTVSNRDRRFILLDGQHRFSALRHLKYTHAYCQVLVGLTPEQEAEHFMRQSENNRPLRPLDLFRAGLIAQEEKCIRINDIVKGNDFDIGFSPKNFREIGAIKALFTIVDDYGYKILDDTLCLIASTWNDTPRAVRSECLIGVAEFVSRFGVANFDERLGHCFQAVWYEYKAVVGRTQSSQKARNHFCRILVKHYNKGMGKNQIRLNWVK